MSSLAHIIAVAEHMLDRYGDEAPRLMAERAADHVRHAEPDGAIMWHSVGVAVRELQRLRNRG